MGMLLSEIEAALKGEATDFGLSFTTVRSIDDLRLLLVASDMRAAVEYANEGRSSHVRWVAHLEAHTDGGCVECDERPYKLDIKHEREWVRKYDVILAALRAPAPEPEEHGETFGEHAARLGDGPCLRCVGKAVVGPAEVFIPEWTSWGIVEIAVRNPSVADYVKHWESRTERAEQQLIEAKTALENVRYSMLSRIYDNGAPDDLYRTEINLIDAVLPLHP